MTDSPTPDHTPGRPAPDPSSAPSNASLGAWVSGPVAPRQIGKYVLGRTLGAGGMGTVFEARHERTDQRAAVKVLRGVSLSPQAAARFEYESRLLAKLSHPAIARVYDAGTFVDPVSREQVPYFAMECVDDARPITEYCESKGVPLADRLALFVRICDAVQHGHANAIIHRDIKPANVIVGSDGHPKLIDFGVARPAESSAEARATFTQQGQLVGTPQYMSPEQAAGDQALTDVRTDVYSLGVLLFEMLTGRLPYSLRGLAIAEATTVIREVAPARLPPLPLPRAADIEAIILRALAKDPARRYPTVRELARDVERYLADEPVEARRYNQLAAAASAVRRTLRHNRVAAHALVIALAVWTGWLCFDLLSLSKPFADRVALFDSLISRTGALPPPDLSRVRLLTRDRSKRDEECLAIGEPAEVQGNMLSTRPATCKLAADLAEAGASVVALDYSFWGESKWDSAAAAWLKRAVELGTPVIIADSHWRAQPDRLLAEEIVNIAGVYRGAVTYGSPENRTIEAYLPYTTSHLAVFPRGGPGRPALSLLAYALSQQQFIPQAAPMFAVSPSPKSVAIDLGISQSYRAVPTSYEDSERQVLATIPISQFMDIRIDDPKLSAVAGDFSAEFQVPRYTSDAYASISLSPVQFLALNPEQRREWCGGKIVIVGDVAGGTEDVMSDGHGNTQPGCLSLAQETIELLNHSWRGAAGQHWEDTWPWMLLAAVLGVVSAELMQRRARVWFGVLAILASIAILTACSVALWLGASYLVNQAGPFIVLLFAFVLSAGERKISNSVRRQELRRSLS